MEVKKTRREIYMDNVLDLSINVGKVNEKAQMILYSKESKNTKQEIIQKTKNDLKNILDNINNIAHSLDISLN